MNSSTFSTAALTKHLAKYAGAHRKMPQSLKGMPVVNASELTEDSTVAEACYAYIAGPRIKSLMKAGSPRAHEPYLQLVKHFGNIELKNFCKTKFASNWRDEKYEELSSGTINMIRLKCKKLCQWLEEKEIVSDNGWARIEGAAVGPTKRRTRMLDQEEVNHMLAYLDDRKVYRQAKNKMYGDIFRLALLTGMRYAEIVGLTMENVYWDMGYLEVEAQKSKTRTMREVPLCDKAMELLQKWKETAENSEDNRFFPISYNALLQQFREYKKKFKKNVFFHLGRHTAISMYATQAESIGELRAFSGHASLTSLDKYVHRGTAFRTVIQNKMTQGGMNV